MSRDLCAVCGHAHVETDPCIGDPAPLARRSRSSSGRKDRRRWCRGRVGIEHRSVIDYPPNLPGWVTRRHEALCGPSTNRYLTGRWMCHHVERCVVCGRIMRESLDTRCPRYDADAPPADVEHWPTNWVVVPTQTERVVEAVQPRRPMIKEKTIARDEYDMWLPAGCTCGAPTPCRLVETAPTMTTAADTGERTS